MHDGVKCEVVFPTPLPDDPQKWDGWNKYKSTNPYERLCLDAQQNPTNELIEEHCRELLRWWQKKLPLKNQPSNPVAQLLRAGLDESSRYLTEARVELLDPERRKKVDAVLAAEAEQQLVSGIVGMNLAIIQTGDQMTGAQHAIEDLAPGIRRRVKQRDEYFCLSVQSRHGRILHKNW